MDDPNFLHATICFIDFAGREGRQADFIIIADTDVFSDSSRSTTVMNSVPQYFACTKEILAEHSPRLRKLFEEHPEVRVIIIILSTC